LDLGPTVTEKKTNDDDELVVGLLENKSTAHIAKYQQCGNFRI